MSDAMKDTAKISANDAYTAAKELAESYTDLLKQKELYLSKMGTYPHYTLDDAYYLLTQGSHEQSERVQTSGISDPTARAVMNAEKLRDRLNREMDKSYQAEVLDPYHNVCEMVTLFETCMKMLDKQQRHIATQLYIQHRPKNSVVDLDGGYLSRRMLEKETDSILNKFALVFQEYEKYRKTGSKRESKHGNQTQYVNTV